MGGFWLFFVCLFICVFCLLLVFVVVIFVCLLFLLYVDTNQTEKQGENCLVNQAQNTLVSGNHFCPLQSGDLRDRL